MELTVNPLREENVGNGLAAVDIAAMSKLDLLSGEFVEVSNGDETILPRVWPGYPDDEGAKIVRLDAEHRDALGVSVGETVDVLPTMPTDAEAILVGVEEPFASLTSFKHSLLADLEDCVLAAGTTVETTFKGAPDRSSIPVAVAASRPEGVVRVTPGTDVEVRAYSGAGKNRRRYEGKTEGANASGDATRSEDVDGSENAASSEDAHANSTDDAARDGEGQGNAGGRTARSDGGEAQVQASPEGDVQTTRPGTTYADVGGLDDALKRVRELVELPFQRPDLFDDLGVSPPAGVLLHGPPGTGKTLLARAVANEVDASFISLPAAEVMSRYYGESEEYLRDVFEDAEESAPAVVFIDEVDAITPERSEAAGDVERRVVAQLLTLMDGLDQTSGVVVIGATNRPDAIDPALRRGGRFDREVEITIPDRDGRAEVLAIHARDVPLADDVDLDAVADRTHGFVGADLSGVVQEAAMHALQRVHGSDGPTDEFATAPETTNGTATPGQDASANANAPANVAPSTGANVPANAASSTGPNAPATTGASAPGSAPEVTMADFEHALANADPAALRDMQVEVPTVTWDDVGGLDDVKRTLREAIEWPMRYPNVLEHAGLDTSDGVLLYGPPGTGKTLLAKAVATESECNLLSIQGPELLSKWVGESESRVRDVFQRARDNAPAIVLIDEIDAVASERGTHSGSGVGERVVGQLLTELDGVGETEDVLVVATTNRPELLDDALLRPGRLDRQCHVPVPDEAARREIFDVQTADAPIAPDVDLADLAARTDGYVGADVEAICREASSRATRAYLEATAGDDDRTDANVDALTVTREDFEAALTAVGPSVTEQTRERYEAYSQRRDQQALDASSGVGFQ